MFHKVSTHWLGSINQSFRHYPMAIFVAFTITLALIISINYSHEIVSEQIAATGIAGFFIMTLLHRLTSKPGWIIAGVGVIALYGWYLAGRDHYFFAITTIFTIIILLLLILALPLQANDDTDIAFWQRVVTLKTAILTTLFFTLILESLLMLLIAMVTSLFSLPNPGVLYESLGIFLLGVFSYLYFLGLIHTPTKEISYGKIADFFVRYLLTIIMGIYSLVLVLFVIQMIVDSTRPPSMTALLSLCFAFMAIFSYIAWIPYTIRYKKILLYAALIQLSLLFVSLYTHISKYGWNEELYMVCIGGLWAFGSLVYMIWSKKVRYDTIMLALAALLFIARFVPYVNAYDTQIRSQKSIFLDMVSSVSSPHRPTSNEIYEQAMFLITHGEGEFIFEAIPQLALEREEYTTGYGHISDTLAFAVTDALGLGPVNAASGDLVIMDSREICRRRPDLDSAPERMWTLRRSGRGRLAGGFVDSFAT